MAIPNIEEMKLPILEHLADPNCGDSVSADDMRSFVISHFKLTDEDVAEKWKRVPEYSGRMQWALTDLAHAGLLSRPSRGHYAITDEGRKELASGNTDFSRQYLEKVYPSFAAFLHGGKSSTENPSDDEEESEIDYTSLNELVAKYREGLQQHWHDECYKWQAVKRFQDVWDIESPDFAAMLDEALDKTENLLVSGNYYARGMISQLAHQNPEKVRAMFRRLFDESEDLASRVKKFAEEAEEFRNEPDYDGWKSTYQDAHAISVYLWLRFPDKYYIYKYSLCRALAKAVGSSFAPGKGGIPEKIVGTQHFYDQVREVIAEDSDVVATFESLVDHTCYEDPRRVTLTCDFGFYVGKYLPSEDNAEPESSPEPDKDEEPLDHAWFVGASWSKGGDQTQRFLDEGVWQNGYEDKYLDQVRSMSPGDRIAIKAAYTKSHGLPFENNGATVSTMAVKARGVVVSNEGDGRTVHVDWDKDFEPREWYFYTYRGTVWRVTREREYGAMLIDFAFDNAPQDYSVFTNDPFWQEKLSPAEAGEEPDQESPVEPDATNIAPEAFEPYSREAFFEDCFMNEVDYDRLKTLLKRKKNVLLQGAPGTGKTYTAKRLVWSLMGETDFNRLKMVQFHQSTSYEEFICGYRPTSDGGFEARAGIFVDFCDRAAADPGRDYYFIVDEINRANISKVFGELLMLIESDKRGEKLELPVLERTFTVPENVYLIGTMNTADRGLALIDYALRRRFAFFEMPSAVGTQRFDEYIASKGNAKLSKLVEAVADLNKTICADDALGRGFAIGHSYFCLADPVSDEDVELVVDYELAPLLEEYWFDSPKKAQEQIEKLRASIA